MNTFVGEYINLISSSSDDESSLDDFQSNDDGSDTEEYDYQMELEAKQELDKDGNDWESESNYEPESKKVRVTQEENVDNGEYSGASLNQQFSRHIIDDTGTKVTLFADHKKILNKLEKNFKAYRYVKAAPFNLFAESTSKHPRRCCVENCPYIGGGDSICIRHSYYYREMVALCSGEELVDEEEVHNVRDLEEKAEKLLNEKVLIELNDPKKGVYIGISTQVDIRLDTHKVHKKHDKDQILIECDTTEEAAHLEYFLIRLLSKKIDNRRIDNRVAGGAFAHNRNTRKCSVYMLIFDNYLKENMPVKRANYSDLKYFKRSLARVYRKEDYSDCLIPKIVSKLSIKSVMKLLGLKVRENRFDKGKDKEECCKCKKLVSKTEMLRHIREAHETKVNCEYCNIELHSAAALRAHIKNFHPNQTYITEFEVVKENDKVLDLQTCPVCNTKYCKASKLTQHLQRYKNTAFSGKSTCDRCEKIFISHVALILHKTKYCKADDA